MEREEGRTARHDRRGLDRWAGRRHAMPLSSAAKPAARPPVAAKLIPPARPLVAAKPVSVVAPPRTVKPLPPARPAAAARPVPAPVSPLAAPRTDATRARHVHGGLRRPQRAVIVISAIVLAASMSVAVSKASRWGRTAGSFVLDDVEIRGNRVLTDEEVVALSGLELGANLLTVRIGDVENAIARSPRVARVRVSRALPGKVIVTLDEKLPVALVAGGHGEALEVAADGETLPPVARSARVDLPLITGAAGARALAPEDIAGALDMIVRAKEESPFFAAEISEVRIAPGSGLVIYTVADGAEIRVGSGALDERGMRRLSMVLSDLRSRGVRAESIDARFRDQIVVRPAA